jgi:hypothetical protein
MRTRRENEENEEAKQNLIYCVCHLNKQQFNMYNIYI